MRQAKCEQKRTKWWNNEVKEAVKKKKVVYIVWLQQKTSEAREEYHRAKRQAQRVVRKAQNEEWVELGKSLQDEFQRNQRSFWRRVMNRSERTEAGKVCDENGEVIADGDRAVNRWKEYFASLPSPKEKTSKKRRQ